jgi:hypothetical protein
MMWPPNDVPPEMMAEDLRQMLGEYERALVKFRSKQFPVKNNRGPFPHLDVQVDWLKGGTSTRKNHRVVLSRKERTVG